jgi:hypothetical protein
MAVREPRILFNFRISLSGLDWAREIAAEYPTLSISDVMRASLAVAKKHQSEVRSRLTTLAEQE